MSRGSHITVALLTSLAFAPLAQGQNKPSVAILGLEVVGDDTLSAKTTRAAQTVTEELRYQATLPSSPYRLAPNSAKDFLELKILSDCTNENQTCLAQIGRDLGADRLVYGKLEKRNKKYLITLNIVNTADSQTERSTSELVAISEVRPRADWGAALYAKLVGTDIVATVVISANANKGTVYVDGVVRTTLSDGQATISELSSGVHAIAVEAPGFARYEADVSVDPGATERLALSLVALDVDKPRQSSARGWRYAFAGGLIATGGMAAGWIYNGLRVRGVLADNKDAAFRSIEETDSACQANPAACNETYLVGRIAESADDVSVHVLDVITGDSIGTRRPSQVPNDECGLDGDYMFGSANCRVATIGDSCSAAKKYRSSLSEPSTAELDAYISACEKGERGARLSNIFLAGSIVSAGLTTYFGYKGWFDTKGDDSEKTAIRILPELGAQSVGLGLTLSF